MQKFPDILVLEKKSSHHLSMQSLVPQNNEVHFLNLMNH